MGSTSISVVIPGGGARDAAARQVAAYFETTGFTFEIVTPGGPYAEALRRGVSEAKGEMVVVLDPRLPYAVSVIGDAVALIQEGAAEVVFGSRQRSRRSIARWLLASILPDAEVRLLAFTSVAAKIVVGETRQKHDGVELEIGFLANKYGFRVELLPLDATPSRRSFGVWGGALTALSVRLANRRTVYRAARRCPVCFSSEVWSLAQIPGKLVRSCRRCKCRFLNEFASDEGGLPVLTVLRGTPREAPGYELHAPPARERTSLRRYHWLNRQISARARVLEVGVRDGGFGKLTSRDYEYVGIEPAAAAARHARASGLDVYCATLSSFVNTGPSFDAITLFHVFENMPDPHDALARIRDLLKPGGLLLLSASDTEGILYLASEKRQLAQSFRTHLILYSRSALIELLEHSGFEIIDIGPDFEYRDHKLLRHLAASYYPKLAPLVRAILRICPDPLIVSTGAIRIAARRRSGPAARLRAIRSAEPTHAR